MPNDMGTFRVDMELENPAKPGVKRTLQSVLVDTGAELSWVPTELLESLGVERNNQWRFRQANGTVLERWTGTVSVYVAGKRGGRRSRVRRAGRPDTAGLSHVGRPQLPSRTRHEAARRCRTGARGGIGHRVAGFATPKRKPGSDSSPAFLCCSQFGTLEGDCGPKYPPAHLLSPF